MLFKDTILITYMNIMHETICHFFYYKQDIYAATHMNKDHEMSGNFTLKKK